MKYSQRGYVLAPTLAKLMLSTVYARNNRFSTWNGHNQRMLITYVPTLPKKTITRGFYGVGLLASCLASHLTVSCMHGNLLRKKQTHAQEQLGRIDRFHNVSHDFYIQYPHRFCDQDILLIDDVYTTGATSVTCVQRLYSAGARSVHVLTLAQTLS